MPFSAVTIGVSMIVTGLFAGGPSVLESSGQRSGIVKPARPSVRVTHDGIVGDVQVDRRYHGGPEQAAHQFAVAHYAAIVTRYPALAGVAVPGSIGENLSCATLDETTVCVGDVYSFGEVALEVSQPRRPCTKIDARYAMDGMARWIAARGTPGWYYRVVKPGVITVGDPVALVTRPNPDVPLARLIAATGDAQPDITELERLVACTGLGSDWQRRLRERLAHVRQRG